MLKSFSLLDIVVSIMILLLGIRCLMRGLVKEVFSLAGVIGAFVLSRLFYKSAAAIFRPMVDTDLKANILGYASIMIGIIIAAAVCSWLISRMIRKTVLSPVDRIGGFAVGVLQGSLLLGVILMVMEHVAGVFGKSVVENSIVAPKVLEFARFLSGIVLKK